LGKNDEEYAVLAALVLVYTMEVCGVSNAEGAAVG
jgi:hypothetical protein